MTDCHRMLGLSLAIAMLCCPSAAAQTSAQHGAQPVAQTGAPTRGQTLPPGGLEQVRQLAAERRWQEIAQLLGPVPARTADMDFYYGTALARMRQWIAAENAFDAGRRLAPRDPRFPVELAGVAFQQKHYTQATRSLRQAIKLDPHNAYADDFLGTVYYLQGNLAASLKYWNRVGKPEVSQIQKEPLPRISPALLDEAFAASPDSILQLSQLLDTRARLRGLGIFPQFQLGLTALDDGKFNLQFRSQERNGFGQTKSAALFQLLRGLPFSSVDPAYYNLHREAINFVSMYRWDAQKRRIYARFSSPFEHSAKYRTDVSTDLRDEEWVIRNSSAGPAPVLASVNLRHEQLTFDLASYASGRWDWSAGAQVSHRDFRSIEPGTVLTPQLLAKGYQLKQLAEVGAVLWRIPERRFSVDATVSSQAARLWSQPEESFEKLQGSLGWHWSPMPEGDDYQMQQRVRAGKTFGTPPFDELFMLGLERDNDLPLRGHIGSRNGQKGSAPMGREYFLSNWEMDKDVYGNGAAEVRIGPFLDTGRIYDPILGPAAGPASHEWLCDVGAQVKLSVFGSGVVFSYGKDLRSGDNVFYVTVLKQARTE